MRTAKKKTPRKMLTLAIMRLSRNSSWRFLSERRNGRIFQYDHPLSARGLFALFGFFPALFGLGLVVSCVALDRWLSKTGRDDHEIPNIIALAGYAVGHWWQGRVAEGAGLIALHVGVILVLEKLRI